MWKIQEYLIPWYQSFIKNSCIKSHDFYRHFNTVLTCIKHFYTNNREKFVDVGYMVTYIKCLWYQKILTFLVIVMYDCVWIMTMSFFWQRLEIMSLLTTQCDTHGQNTIIFGTPPGRKINFFFGDVKVARQDAPSPCDAILQVDKHPNQLIKKIFVRSGPWWKTCFFVKHEKKISHTQQ